MQVMEGGGIVREDAASGCDEFVHVYITTRLGTRVLLT